MPSDLSGRCQELSDLFSPAFFDAEKGARCPCPKPPLPAALGVSNPRKDPGSKHRGPLKQRGAEVRGASDKACLSFRFYFTTHRGSEGRARGDIKHRGIIAFTLQEAVPLRAGAGSGGAAGPPAPGLCWTLVTHTRVFVPHFVELHWTWTPRRKRYLGNKQSQGWKTIRAPTTSSLNRTNTWGFFSLLTHGRHQDMPRESRSILPLAKK